MSPKLVLESASPPLFSYGGALSIRKEWLLIMLEVGGQEEKDLKYAYSRLVRHRRYLPRAHGHVQLSCLEGAVDS